MTRKSISWILDFTSKLPNKEEKVKCLMANDMVPIRTILRCVFDPSIKFLLPTGDAPYTPSSEDQGNTLYSEARRLYLFVEGGNPNLTQVRREDLFLALLQTLNAEDAKLLVAMKDKKLPFKGITKDIVLTAYPDLF